MTEETSPPLPNPFLLPEILGFAPQLLLDDIINIANNAVQDGVRGMEELLQKWVDDRAERKGEDSYWDGVQEVEQGLVSFQTLLEYHTDLAFDLFEAWSLRNVFAIPPDYPIIMPHHRNLDLSQPPEKQRELLEELEDLRKKLDYERRLRRAYKMELKDSERGRQRAERRLEELSPLESLRDLGTIPAKAEKWFQEVFHVPSVDIAGPSTIPMVEPGKRQWEMGSNGYFKWAVAKLIERTNSARPASASFTTTVQKVGTVQSMRALRQAMNAIKDEEDVHLDTSNAKAPPL